MWNPQYKTLDHWRGFAAFWVVMYHGFAPLYDKNLHPIANLLKSLAKPGWLGVHIFFVISGYCIAVSVYRLFLKNGNAWTFIKNRAVRLLPVYWLSFLLALIINIITIPFNGTSFWENFPSWQEWIANILLIQPYVDITPYVVVYWSLAIEVAFYLIVTGLLIIQKIFNPKVAIFIGLFLGFLSIFIYLPRLPFLSYWCEFVCGVLLFFALLSNHNKNFSRRNLSLVLIILMMILSLWINYTYKQNQLWYSAIFTICLYNLYFIDSKIANIKQIKWLQLIGLMSYSLYLLHSPFQGKLINLGIRFIPINSSIIVLLQIFGWIVALIASYIFYRFVEKPLNDWRYRRKTLKITNN
ncbi:MAG: acyltransferase family protein [Mastigocoleus sp.]